LTSVPEKDKHGRLLADICLMDGTFAKEGDVRAEIALHLHSGMRGLPLILIPRPVISRQPIDPGRVRDFL